MLIRKFDPSASSNDGAARAALGRYEDIVNDRSRYPGTQVSAEITLPVEHEVAWQLLLETQHMGHWLNDRSKPPDFPLPASFCRGQSINRASCFVLDCESTYTGKTKLTIQRSFYSDGRPVYYTFELSPYERFTSKLSAVAEYRFDRLGGAAMFARSVFNIGDEKGFEVAKQEIGQALRTALKRFASFCWDRTEFGPASRDYPGIWFTWHYEPDRLHFYKNRNGHDGPELGEPIRDGERIGFLHPTGAPEPLDQWKSSHYIEPAGGYVLKLLKKHGDRVEYGDRILLTARDHDADLSVASLKVGSLVEAAGGDSSNRSRVAQFGVEVGQRIKQGDVLATLVDSHRSAEEMQLRSPNCGVVASRAFDVGADLHLKEFETLVTIRCDRASVTG